MPSAQPNKDKFIMHRRDLLKLSLSSTLMTVLLKQSSVATTRLSSATAAPKLVVNWNEVVAKTTVQTFGSNDYEVLDPAKASDLLYQNRLADLKMGLIRIHHASISDRWSDAATRTWDVAKIKASYDAASYLKQAKVIQNIPGWPQWMQQDTSGLLDPSQYGTYANFCAELVRILNKSQQRNVLYWEPVNEKDVLYQKAGKLDDLWKLYNQCAVAMKGVDPRIKIGGPVLTWDNTNLLDDYLRACQNNIDFISWHRYGSGNANESTDTLMAYTPNYGNQVRKIREITNQYLPGRQVPLFLGEYNINYSWKSGEQRQNTHIGAVWFASVLKHLADAGIEMAASWHLKDGIYGMIDPQNQLRPAATVFEWGLKYLIGEVIQTQSSHPFLEALAIRRSQREHALLLINKSGSPTPLNLQFSGGAALPKQYQLFKLNATGLSQSTLNSAVLQQQPLSMNPYSLLLLNVVS
jgi:Glycosyl hydrolases family 39